jgi:penicillin-binding protein-related factor A (putative recombinase)
MYAAGRPDIIGCYQGLFFAFEVKRPGEDLTPLQAHSLQQIKKSGGTASKIHSFEEAQVLIRERLSDTGGPVPDTHH